VAEPRAGRRALAARVADLLGDKGKEILFSTGERRLVCCAAGGQPLWDAELGCDNRSGPVAADLDGDGVLEIVIGGEDGRLRCFARDGQRRWQYAATAEIDSAIACGDLDGDGRLETVGVDLRGHCFCLDAGGAPRWTYNVRNRCRRSPALADLDGDAQIEILVAGYDARIYVLSHDGQEEDIVDIPGTTNGGATLVTAGGHLAAVIPFANGQLGCYSWLAPDRPAPRALPVLWGAYRVTPTQRGALEPAAAAPPDVHLLSAEPGQLLVGRNLFEVRVANPAGRRLALELEIDGPAGSGPARERVESSAAVVTARLPYLISGEYPQTLNTSFRSRGRRSRGVSHDGSHARITPSPSRATWPPPRRRWPGSRRCWRSFATGTVSRTMVSRPVWPGCARSWPGAARPSRSPRSWRGPSACVWPRAPRAGRRGEGAPGLGRAASGQGRGGHAARARRLLGEPVVAHSIAGQSKHAP